ncbi:arylamine N-acetyltransferase family protein [Novosphingobium terrae]|uniref:arylamine N-acetyltransferase family protein n=1 Tax=Novosphingobium terrae TaxID=2726189 RepID=UPI00197DDFFC|nr:arylamine N-acetyltransferase [Novosphingobium terrae]
MENQTILDAYLSRIGLTGKPAPDAAGLEALQRAHRLSIGFENLDVMLGRPIHIDLVTIADKLIARHRGGYCFEHNALFGAMLTELGFTNRPLLGRVWLGSAWPGEATTIPPQTHTLRLASIAGEPWIADAGFGGSYVPPLPLLDGAQAATPDGALHRLRRVGADGAATGEWLLERAGPASATDGRAQTHDTFQPQYSFTLAEVAPIDLELSNHWTFTRAGTRFTSACLVSIVLPDGFASLNGRRLSVHRAGQGEASEIASAAAWREVLGDLFRIDLGAEEAEKLFEQVS